MEGPPAPSSGPLPYNKEECSIRLIERVQEGIFPEEEEREMVIQQDNKVSSAKRTSNPSPPHPVVWPQ